MVGVMVVGVGEERWGRVIVGGVGWVVRVEVGEVVGGGEEGVIDGVVGGEEVGDGVVVEDEGVG